MLHKTPHSPLEPALDTSSRWMVPSMVRQTIPGAARAITMRHVAPPFLTVLVLAALIDWLVTRTFTRFAIFIPKSPALIAGYEATSWLGLVGTSAASILALAGLAWAAGQEWRLRRYLQAPGQRIPWLGMLFVVLGSMSILFLFVPPGTWALFYNGVMLVTLTMIVGRSVHFPVNSPVVSPVASPVANSIRMAILLPAFAMFIAGFYQSVPGLYAAMQWPGPPVWSSRLYQAGEILVVGGSLALWWAYGRSAPRRIWAWTALPALVFAAVFLAESALTATIIVWSNGLTLFLPWWLYAAAIWLVGLTLLQTWRTGRRIVTAAILLLCAAGYAPQLSSQFFFGLLALWLLLIEQEREIAQEG